jgi:peptide/nickel transport system substrate-binding protein
VLPEYNTRLVELEKGTIDLMQSIRIADADRLADDHPEIKLYRRGWRAMDYVGWNNLDPDDLKEKKKAAEGQRKARFAEIDAMGVSDDEKASLKQEASAQFKVKVADVAPHPLWGDTAVRVALTKAIDRKKIIKDLLTSDKTGESYGRESVSTITPELCKAHANDIEPLGYNPEEAKAELAALGWTDSDGDGVLDKDGKAFSFTLETNSENPRRADAAIIIQANLKAIGVEVQIEKLEFNTFSEKHRNRDFHASLGGWSAGLFVDPAVIWGDPDENDFNFIAYDNEEVQALIAKGLSTPDPDDAAPIWREVQEKIYAEQPYTFLYWRDEIVGLHERFENAKIDVLSPYRDLHEWSVPADKVKYKR